MPRPSIILKEILTHKEWNMIRTVYILRSSTEEEMINSLGEMGFQQLLYQALTKIFTNEEAKDYLRSYIDSDLYKKLFDLYNQRIHEDSFRNPNYSLTKEYLSSLDQAHQVVAQYYLGIGTGTFFCVQAVLKKLQECSVSYTYASITKFSQEILEDLRDPKYRDIYLEIADKYCKGALLDRIHCTLLGEKISSKPAKEEAPKEAVEVEVSKPASPAKNILEQILSLKEYQVFYALYLDKKVVCKEDLERKMGTIPLSYYLHNAIRKVFQNELAKYYVMNQLTTRKQKQFMEEYEALPTYHGSLDDASNPFTQDLLSKFSPESKFVAQYHFGIGTGKFLTKKALVRSMAANPLWNDVNEVIVESLIRKVSKDIVAYDYIEDYYALLLTCSNPKMQGTILTMLEKTMHMNENAPEVVPHPKKVPTDVKSFENFLLRQKEFVTANLKRGYLFQDTFLNVTSLSKEKEMTMKALTHHEGLLKLSKKSHRVGGMKSFLAIAIFINFIDAESFHVGEIASILEMTPEEANDVIHTKASDFIALLPEEMTISYAHKLEKVY